MFAYAIWSCERQPKRLRSKTGHYQIQTRPLGVKTGRAPHAQAEQLMNREQFVKACHPPR